MDLLRFARKKYVENANREETYILKFVNYLTESYLIPKHCFQYPEYCILTIQTALL